MFKLYKSDKPNKKFVVKNLLTNKNIYFGSSTHEDYTIHKDDDRKRLYLLRHKKNENWHDYNSAGFWSRWLLWNLPTIKESIIDIEKRFNIVVVSA